MEGRERKGEKVEGTGKGCRYSDVVFPAPSGGFGLFGGPGPGFWADGAGFTTGVDCLATGILRVLDNKIFTSCSQPVDSVFCSFHCKIEEVRTSPKIGVATICLIGHKTKYCTLRPFCL